ncbi:MAG: hypothetical protein QS748_08140 [Candidatus Endonucleobacter bathymodioli]|uniref:Lipoprotein n=1 Tax=Candidatus Endonucleibacter bathymodioli TaxID=539814 RepID=A0AA90SDC7_9GAMM|nr:hypothetical protein [Candidatus Endonucleobacter bathymodioli]
MIVTKRAVYTKVVRLLNNRKMLVLVATAVIISGCATSSKNMAETYVSPMRYESYNCKLLAFEAQRIQESVYELGGNLDKSASNDKVVVGIGVIFFWPLLFALGGTKAQETEYARLKGEYNAIQQAAVIKRCRDHFIGRGIIR